MKILYLSCHSILEHDEVSLFNELRYEIFSPGAFVEPLNPGDASLRPGIQGLVYNQDIVNQWHRLCAQHPGEDGKNHLTKEFVDNFDCVIVMHLPRWIQLNWDVMKHKRVIWRTIGQSVASTEASLKPYRDQGLEIVRYSPREIHIPGFIGQDAMIRFYKNETEYGPWNGDNERVITFAQSMKQRGSHCGYEIFKVVTDPFDRALFGPGNDSEPWMYGKVSFDQLKKEMRDNRAYFYTGTHPASYTLNFIEAFMTGIPIVAIGSKYGNADWCRNHNLYEIQDFIINGQNGLISDDLNELRSYIDILLKSKDIAYQLGKNGRETAIQLFGKQKISKQWREYLGQ